MNIRILNRAGKLPDDGFYQIEALGEHINHDARVVQVIDAKAVDSICNRFAADAKAAGEDFPGMRIDKDHLSQSMENPTESLGWSMRIENRGGVPMASIAWTSLGLPLVESKPGQPPVYKFFSTEYDPAECEKIGTRIVNRKTYAVVRPLRLAGLSLTNDPNNKGQRPISNRNGTSAGAADENQNEKPMKSLLKKLGLAEDASEESAVAAVETIQNRATKAEANVATLTQERDQLLTAQVESDLEKYKNRFKPENRDKIKAALIRNRTSTIELLEATAPAAPEAGADTKRITNRTTATPPAGAASAGAEEEESAKERARGAKISNRAAELRRANPRLTRAQAFAKAEAELPAE